LIAAGWDINSQVREQVYLTDGQVIVRGRMVRRGERKFADYVLFYKPNIPIAVVEAKDNKHRLGDGMPQALTYAEMLGVTPWRRCWRSTPTRAWTTSRP
jgi:type I restriction enzyme R subunit